MIKPSAHPVIEKQTAGVWMEETAGKHPLGALSPTPVVEEERRWQWAGTYRPGSLLVFLDLVARCALVLYIVHYSLKPGNTTNSNLAAGYCQWQDISSGQVYHWSTCPSTTPPPRGHLYNCSHLTNTFLWIRCKYVYVCNPCFAASMFSTLTNLWLFTLHNAQARLVSRLELCPLFRKFWSAPWDSGWIEDSGSLLHQKYHPQISAGLLSRKSTIGSPSFSGAPQDLAFVLAI